MADTILQRKNMVESQVRPSDITDRRITAAMMSVPREAFVPGALADLAYADTAVLDGSGRGLMAPRDFARLVQLADIGTADRVLDIGCWYGYSAAVLAQLAREVIALELDAEAAQSAREAFSRQAIRNVRVVTGPLQQGHAAAAPYNAIFLEGSVDRVPVELKAQLAKGGRIVAVQMDRNVGRAVILHNDVGDSAPRSMFEASAPRLPGFAAVENEFNF